MNYRDPQDYNWYVLPGRKVAHAIVTNKHQGICGQTSEYPLDRLLEASKHTRRCESCLITIVSGVSASSAKFFQGYVPSSVRVQRRKAWKVYLVEHPEYGPLTWKSKVI